MQQGPINIDEHAARILRVGTRAVEIPLQKRNFMDRLGFWDKPLMAILGENHRMPAHVICQIMWILHELTRREKSIAVGFEKQHNLILQRYAQTTGQTADPATADRLRALDRFGALSLQTDLGWTAVKEADHSHAALVHFIGRHKIPTCFADVAHPGYRLDAGDPSTAISLKKCFGNAVAGIPSVSPEGMFARNQHTADKAYTYAEEMKARIMILSCGGGHVAGHLKKNWQGRQSLAAILQKNNISVTGIPFLYAEFPESAIPFYAPIRGNLHFGEYLPDITARYKPWTNEPVGDANLKDRMAEAAYLNGILPRIGLAADRLLPAYLQQHRETSRSKTAALFNDLKNRTAGEAPSP